jgi:hypothetical protein
MTGSRNIARPSPVSTHPTRKSYPMSDAIVRLTRVKAPVRDRLRSYRVELDGDIIGKVRSGESVDFSVEPGHHRLRMKADWTGSQVLSFEIKKGATAHFECQPNGHSLTALIDTFKSLGTHGDPWVDLRQVSGERSEHSG